MADRPRNERCDAARGDRRRRVGDPGPARRGPGAGTELALARNRMVRRSGYYARWVYVRVEPSPCVFTHGVEPGTLLALPMAHGEGRFTGAPGRVTALVRAGQVPLRYATPGGEVATAFPDVPNGAEAAAAGICNLRG